MERPRARRLRMRLPPKFGDPEIARFHVSKGTVGARWCSRARHRPVSGVEVGDTEDKIKRLYPGRITIEEHKYLNETGHYLNYNAADHADRNYGLVFETDHGRVITYRTGILAAVRLVEGCG